ncbi:TadE/TadG family type IV pilus assembly protein [Timonella sp. A28]|uniref:TadE/TadG family type IV pilus assembly protein n=1 Tax=Timonella sp. A28 TaxID=3442640 RepID=UPI003EC11709
MHDDSAKPTQREHPTKTPHLHHHNETGTVTVEFALMLPAVVMILILCISVVLASLQRAVVQDHARTAARIASTGQPAASSESQHDTDTTYATTIHPPWVTVTATRPIHIAGLTVPGLKLQARATAYLEEHVNSSQE